MIRSPEVSRSAQAVYTQNQNLRTALKTTMVTRFLSRSLTEISDQTVLLKSQIL